MHFSSEGQFWILKASTPNSLIAPMFANYFQRISVAVHISFHAATNMKVNPPVNQFTALRQFFW